MLNGVWDWNRLDAAREVRQQVSDYQVKAERVDPQSPNPAKTSGMNWDRSFEKRMTSKRNRDENGCRVPWQGLNERPRVEGE